MNDIFYYIDETGDINQNKVSERFFTISCCITDTPADINLSLEKLKCQIEDSSALFNELKKFKKDGFHATKNHFDIRKMYYDELCHFNFRAYSIIIDKSHKLFLRLYKCENKYYKVLSSLLFKRILENKLNNNIIILEEYGTNLNKHRENSQKVVDEICEKIKNEHNIYPKVQVFVHDKSDNVLSIVDYMNYALGQMLLEKPPLKMQDYFKILEPKIGLINLYFQKIFFYENNRVDFKSIKSELK